MPGRERGREPLAAAEPDDVVHAVRARDLRRAVARAVVDDEDLDDVDARDRAAAGRASVAGSVCGLVEARDLDDEFRHGHAPGLNARSHGTQISFSMTPSQVIGGGRGS